MGLDLSSHTSNIFRFYGKIPALPANVRLGWKRMAAANTLASYDAATLTAVKSFRVHAADFNLTLPTACLCGQVSSAP